MLTSVIYKKSEFIANATLLMQIDNILKKCYINPAIALEYAMKESDTLYCAYSLHQY